MQSGQGWSDDLAKRLTRASGRPLYEQLREGLRDAIATGRLPPGSTVPAQRSLSRRLGVGEVTLRRALQGLADEGLIEARAGGGTVVAERQASSASSSGNAARSIRPRTIGIAMADITDGYPFLQPFLDGLRTIGDRPSPSLRMFEVPGDPRLVEPRFITAALAGLDGLIVMSPTNLAVVAAAHERRVPVVLMFADVVDGRSHRIVIDYHRGIEDAIATLDAHGRRRIALVTAPPDRFSTPYLVDAYRDALERRNFDFDPSLIQAATYTAEGGRDATLRLLETRDKPNAILYAAGVQADGGRAAINMLQTVRHNDVSVIACGTSNGSSSSQTNPSWIDLRLKETGQASMHLLELSLSNPETSPQRYRFRSQFHAAAM